MAETTIIGPLNDINNNGLPNKWIYFTLLQVGTDGTAGVTVPQGGDSVQTDVNGDFTIQIWDNGESGVESLLEIRIDGSRPVYVIIPAGTSSIELWDLIENYQASDVSPQLPTIADTFLQKSNNLSDLVNASTARTTLGLGTAAVTAATDYATAAQGTLADSALLKTGGAMTGAITTNSTFDGRDVATDGTKLDGIEPLAEVNDPTTLLDADIGVTVQPYSSNQVNLISATKTITSTTYTALVTDRTLLIDDDAAGGDVTITLPTVAAATDGWGITVKKLGSTGDIIFVTSDGSLIDGVASRTVHQKLESTCAVTDGTDWFVMFPTSPTGWAYYSDSTYTSGSPLIPANGVRTLLTIDGLGATTSKDFLPAGVTDFWDSSTNKIVAQKAGDSYDVRIDFTVDVPANTESIKLEVDIGDGSPDIPIVIRSNAYSESGAGQAFSAGFPLFSLSTFIANGGKIYITTSAGGFDIYDIAIFIKRDFSPL